MVLMDVEGRRIHASIKKMLFYKFKNEILEGKVYSFENIGVHINGDVIGLLSELGNEREIQKNRTTTKLNVIELEVDGHKTQCTLFGNYVDELDNFISTSKVSNNVVVVQLAKEDASLSALIRRGKCFIENYGREGEIGQSSSSQVDTQ
ncbi:hypothetical protein RYX36_005697 [Vicia faba]